MKKIIALLTCVFVLFMAIGCESTNNVENKSQNENSTSEEKNKKDDIIFESYKVGKDEDGYFTCTYKVKNNTDENITFHGISIYELDKNGDILDSWQSYNQGDAEAKVEPAQSINFDTMHKVEDGVYKIKSTSYSYEDENGEWIEKDFKEPIIIDCNK